MEHFDITFEPEGRKIAIHAGATILEAAGQAGIILNTVCGAQGTCEKCTVYLEPDAQQVLACQYQIKSHLTVRVPQTSRFFEQRILMHGIDSKVQLTPDIYKKYLDIADSQKIFGLAVDIGTTTVVAKLIDMTAGRCIATEATVNPQVQFGDDCISRINYARTDEKLAELQKTIVECINELTDALCLVLR